MMSGLRTEQIIVLLTLVSSRFVLGCERDWLGFETKCYRAFPGAVSRQAAQGRCTMEGAYLVSITSPKENSFVRRIGATTNATEVWVGLSEVSYEVWAWSDRSEYRWNNFRPGETSENIGQYRWVGMEISDGGWVTHRSNADILMPHVCEKADPTASAKSQWTITRVAAYIAVPASFVAICLVLVLAVVVCRMWWTFRSNQHDEVTGLQAVQLEGTGHFYAVVDEENQGSSQERAGNPRRPALRPNAAYSVVDIVAAVAGDGRSPALVAMVPVLPKDHPYSYVDQDTLEKKHPFHSGKAFVFRENDSCRKINEGSGNDPGASGSCECGQNDVDEACDLDFVVPPSRTNDPAVPITVVPTSPAVKTTCGKETTDQSDMPSAATHVPERSGPNPSCLDVGVVNINTCDRTSEFIIDNVLYTGN